MNPFRCSNCDKLLAKIYESIGEKKITIESEAKVNSNYEVEISCPKCKTMNKSSIFPKVLTK